MANDSQSAKDQNTSRLPNALGPPRGEGGRVLQGGVWIWGRLELGNCSHRGREGSGGRPAGGGGSGILGGG